jgi:hypothetical protein
VPCLRRASCFQFVVSIGAGLPDLRVGLRAGARLVGRGTHSQYGGGSHCLFGHFCNRRHCLLARCALGRRSDRQRPSHHADFHLLLSDVEDRLAGDRSAHDGRPLAERVGAAGSQKLVPNAGRSPGMNQVENGNQNSAVQARRRPAAAAQVWPERCLRPLRFGLNAVFGRDEFRRAAQAGATLWPPR